MRNARAGNSRREINPPLPPFTKGGLEGFAPKSSSFPFRSIIKSAKGLQGVLRPLVLLVLLSFVGLAALACGQGAYPLDIFYEMHYQQSYKSHEPPRLPGVENAVPVDWVPAPKSTSFNTGQHLYKVNCSMCHGTEGKGNGPVLEKMINNYGYEPAVTPDLTSEQVKVIGAPGIQGFMLSGLVVMPSFKKLLTAEEMRMIAEYIVRCLHAPAGEVPPDCA